MCALAWVVLSACPAAPAARTEVIVLVTSELEVPEMLDGLEVQVLAPSGRALEESVVLGPGGQRLPATLGLEWKRGELQPVTVWGMLGAERRATARAITGFVKEQSRLLELLSRPCGSGVPRDETCRRKLRERTAD